MSKTLELLHEAMNSIDGNKRGMDVVVGNIEEAIWGVEALLAAAKNLRAAQRAYMADRGNEELGRAVGDRARELDEAIEAACSKENKHVRRNAAVRPRSVRLCDMSRMNWRSSFFLSHAKLDAPYKQHQPGEECMNRFRKAWLALTDRLEPEVVTKVVPEVQFVKEYVFGQPEEVEVFRAVDPNAVYFYQSMSTGSTECSAQSWHGRYFTSCEQAFNECPGAQVNSVTIYRIGGKYFETYSKLKPIKLQPKPKVPKGKK